MLTGEVRVRQGDVMVDAGHSLNPAVDIGQVLSLVQCDLSHSQANTAAC